MSNIASDFTPMPSWRWYAAAIGVGVAAALAVPLGLEVATPPPKRAADSGGETLAIKTAREPLPPIPVRVIPISPQLLVAPALPPQAAPAPAPQPAQAEPAPASRFPTDICARHGGHRENYKRGTWTGWRCVFLKPKGQ